MEEKFKILITEEELQKRLKELAQEIERDYEGKEITVLCVMRGACFFTVELTLKIKNKMQYEFIELSSYDDKTESSGTITMKHDLRGNIEGKDVLIVEDIVDTGRTMDFLIKHLQEKKPNSIKICTLATRKDRRVVDVDIDYYGFEIPDKYVVGYGFDIDNNYRNIPYVMYVDE